jgi:hypothetical protein
VLKRRRKKGKNLLKMNLTLVCILSFMDNSNLLALGTFNILTSAPTVIPKRKLILRLLLTLVKLIYVLFNKM